MPSKCMCPAVPALACCPPPPRSQHALPWSAGILRFACALAVRSLAPCTSLSQTAACRLQGSAQALTGLLEACEAVLPQARRVKLAREARRHAVARSRAKQKSGGRCSFQRSVCVLLCVPSAAAAQGFD